MRKFLFLVTLLSCCLCITAQTRLDYYYLEAEKCRQKGDMSSATALYQHCLEINPQAPEALYNLGCMNLYMHRDSLGEQMLRQATLLDPGNPWYLEALASVLINKRQVDDAIPVLEKISALQTKRVDVLGQLESYYKSLGRTQDAINTLNRIETLEGKAPQLSSEKYALYIDMGDSISAFRELQSLCDEFPNDMNYRVHMGVQFLKRGNTERAHEIFDYVREIEPNSTSLTLAMMEYYDQMGNDSLYRVVSDSLLLDPHTSTDVRIALMRDYIDRTPADSVGNSRICGMFESLIGPEPSDAKILTFYAAYALYRDFPQAEVANIMQRILAVEPDNQLAMSNLLQYYAKVENYQQLEEICRRGVNYHPEILGYHYYLGITLMQQDKKAEALQVLDNGLRTRSPEETHPTLISDMFAMVGDIYYQMEHPTQAFCAYDSALVYNRDNIMCLNNYAYYLSLRNENLAKAEEMSYRTIKAEPENRIYLDTYAWILFMQDRYSEARHYIDLVVSPDSTESSLLADEFTTSGILEHAGDIAWKCNLTDRALWLWNLAVQRGDSNATAALPKKNKKRKYIK